MWWMVASLALAAPVGTRDAEPVRSLDADRIEVVALLLADEGQDIALLRVDGDSENLARRVGDRVGDFEVATISHDRVTLRDASGNVFVRSL